MHLVYSSHTIWFLNFHLFSLISWDLKVKLKRPYWLLLYKNPKNVHVWMPKLKIMTSLHNLKCEEKVSEWIMKLYIKHMVSIRFKLRFKISSHISSWKCVFIEHLFPGSIALRVLSQTTFRVWITYDRRYPRKLRFRAPKSKSQNR